MNSEPIQPISRVPIDALGLWGLMHEPVRAQTSHKAVRSDEVALSLPEVTASADGQGEQGRRSGADQGDSGSDGHTGLDTLA